MTAMQVILAVTLYICVADALSGTIDGISPTVLEAVLDRLNTLEENNAILEKTVVEQQTAFNQRIAELEVAVQTNCANDRERRLVMDSGSGLPIAFTTRLTPRVLDHVNPGDVISFDNVLTNHGGGLNASSSVFTAPMAGFYLLSCSMMDAQARSDGSGVKVHADIVKNGQVVLGRVFAHAEGISYRDQGAQTVIVELKNGDQVWVRNGNSKDLRVGGELYSTFSGYLLWPME